MQDCTHVKCEANVVLKCCSFNCLSVCPNVL